MDSLVNRLRGLYPIGPIKDGVPEFGMRDFGPVPPIQVEAADEIERLRAENRSLRAAQKACETCDAPTMAEVERLRADSATLQRARKLVAEQANNPGLWFEAATITENYLQNALRELARVIEGV